MIAMQKHKIFVSIIPGFCKEYKYFLSFTGDPSKRYKVFPITTSISAELDLQHIDILQNINIDYKTSIIANKFYVSVNESATSVCRCGISFSSELR